MAQRMANVAASIRIAPRSLERCSQNGSSGAHREANFAPCARAGSEPDRLLQSTLGFSGTELTDGLTAAPIAVKAQEASTSLKGADRQMAAEIENLNAVIGYEMADNTRKNYLGQWLRFCSWALNRSIDTLPADPAQVGAYLAERFERQGHRPATLHMAAAAITFFHRFAGLEDPCDTSEVKRALKSATRKAGRLQRQAEALTAESLEEIRETACMPRRGRGGRAESPATASLRGRIDIAMISLMRDAMLRVSEAATLKWADIEAQIDGSGRLLIRRSKTDVFGEGAVAYISFQTMEALMSIRAGATDLDSVFELRPNQISRRIKQAALAAGLGDGYSGHSPRVGMARDLARFGTELSSLMSAGRWSSPRMPALYIRNEAAGRGAVALYYSACQQMP